MNQSSQQLRDQKQLHEGNSGEDRDGFRPDLQAFSYHFLYYPKSEATGFERG